MDLRVLLPGVPFRKDHIAALGQQTLSATMPNG